jgi:hypothetical protein
MRTNVSLNKLEGTVSVEEFNWSVCGSIDHSFSSVDVNMCRGSPIPDTIPHPQLVLAADCVYFEPTFPLLIQTLSDLVSHDNTEVLFCYKKRRKVNFRLHLRRAWSLYCFSQADKRFFSMLKKKVSWVEVSIAPIS